MRYTVHTNKFRQRLSQVFSSADAIMENLSEDAVQLPDGLHQWLGRLKLLYGVPFNYLVADEAQLPPESIRFFYVDVNWINALLDGAYSIGRNLTSAANTASMNMDKATFAGVKNQAEKTSRTIRGNALGMAATLGKFDVVSGFLLRSVLVSQYPGMGVNIYPSPDTPGNLKPLEILRFEVLGPQSDTMICLVEGDAYKVDLHEPPEHLHYGIDDYKMNSGVVSATKKLRTFTVSGNDVKIDIDNIVKQDISNCFRPNAKRTLQMTALAGVISKAANNNNPVDSSEIGFEMTEGVGKVSFNKKS
jgi:hypothetical protein